MQICNFYSLSLALFFFATINLQQINAKEIVTSAKWALNGSCPTTKTEREVIASYCKEVKPKGGNYICCGQIKSVVCPIKYTCLPPDMCTSKSLLAGSGYPGCDHCGEAMICCQVERFFHITGRRWTLPQDCPIMPTELPVKSRLCPPPNPLGPRMICCGTAHVFPAPFCGKGKPVYTLCAPHPLCQDIGWSVSPDPTDCGDWRGCHGQDCCRSCTGD